MSAPVPEVAARPLRRRMLRWTFLLLLTYLGIVTVLWFLERRLVFHPVSAEEEWLKPEDARSQDVWFYSADGTKIAGRWIPPELPERGAVLVLNGNGGNLTHRGRLAAQFRNTLGAGVLLFDYPGYGKNAGSPTEEGCYAASEAAYSWLTEEHKVPPNRIILCGQSLGGGPAVELATKHDHRALVLLYTFASVPAVAKDRFPFLPAHTLMRTRFDNLGKIGRCTRPVFIVHGTDDRVIPVHHSDELFAAANEPKHYLRIPDFGHSALIGEPFTSELASFLQKHAK